MRLCLLLVWSVLTMVGCVATVPENGVADGSSNQVPDKCARELVKQSQPNSHPNEGTIQDEPIDDATDEMGEDPTDMPNEDLSPPPKWDSQHWKDTRRKKHEDFPQHRR
ncbi:hypothetical protein OAU50_07370 [Planctomycetota bacterium]|nr:hypothetical protein [Planctomycetota bacterium]